MLPKLFIITTIFIVLIQKSSQKYYWRGCNPNHEKPPECSTKFPKPPLVILSLDGFRSDYLNNRIVRTLDLLAECGAKAEHVYPSYPSKTLPNHYTMVTGLYPESHGIVDNQVFDTTLKKFVDIKLGNTTKYYGGEPIWSMFKRHFPTKLASSFSWIGSEMNLHPDHPLDYVKPFEKNFPFKSLLQEVQNQLLNETGVPGLIVAYHDQPDRSGHHNIKSEHKMKEDMQQLDGELDHFLNQLHTHKILDCINFVVVSDHGMHPMTKNVEIPKYVESQHLEGVSISKNIIGTLHNFDSEGKVSLVYEELACKLRNVTVYTKATMPVRKHYAGHASIGDVILEGAPGITFGKTPYDRQGDHGYDYLHESMFTIFIGRGPSFKQGVTIEAFQNIQLMNLWIDLLDIPLGEKLNNNGSVGFFDKILMNPRKVLENATNRIVECKVKTENPEPKKCPNQSPEQPTLNCKKTGARLPFLSNNENHCYESYCQDNIIRHKKCSACVVISETLKRDKLGHNNFENMKFYDNNYEMNARDVNKCEDKRGHVSISVRKTLMDSFISIVDGQEFYEKVLSPMNVLTNRYLRFMKVLHVLSGTVVDKNFDGVADDDISESTLPTHIFRILIFCTSGWRSISPPRCKSPKNMRTKSFIFPIAKAKAWNCMTPDQLLLEYTATIADVERISGFKFHIEEASTQVTAKIRQHIVRSLWKIEHKNLSGMPNFVAVIIFVVCLVL